MDYSKMRVLVVGMARSGIAAAQLLYKLGTKEIILNDMRDREAFSGKLDDLLALGMTDRLGMEPDSLIHGCLLYTSCYDKTPKEVKK